jgi:L-2-hydroxyglutarate oxidase LhgO
MIIIISPGYLNFFLYLFLKGLRALHSPHTGIVDYGLLCRHFGKSFERLGGRIALNFEAVNFLPSGDASYPILVKSKSDVSPLLLILLI